MKILRLLTIAVALVMLSAGHVGRSAESPLFLTHGTGFADYWPCFSPDGTHIIFSRAYAGQGAPWELWIVDVKGGQPGRFFAEPLRISATRASWSHDGQSIAFSGVSRSGETRLWIVGADGKGAHELAGVSIGSFYPSWYPDDSAVVVMDGQALQLARVGLHGEVTMLTDPKALMTGMPSISPDGQIVAFAGQPNRGTTYNQEINQIWLLDVQSGQVRSLESPPVQGRAPSWSPDGKYIAFESERGNPVGHKYAIFIEHPDGTGLKRLTDYALNATHPVFSRDGKHMAFAAMDKEAGLGTRIAILNVEMP